MLRIRNPPQVSDRGSMPDSEYTAGCRPSQRPTKRQRQKTTAPKTTAGKTTARENDDSENNGRTSSILLGMPGQEFDHVPPEAGDIGIVRLFGMDGGAVRLDERIRSVQPDQGA